MPRGKGDNQLSDTRVLRDSLGEQLTQSSAQRFLHRLHCVLLVAEGHTASEVARWFGDDASSVARWVRHYREFGIHGLQEDRRSGRPAKLDIDQTNALKRDLLDTPRCFGHRETAWDGRVLRAHIYRQFNVDLSIRQCQRLLRRLRPADAMPDGMNDSTHGEHPLQSGSADRDHGGNRTSH